MSETTTVFFFSYIECERMCKIVFFFFSCVDLFELMKAHNTVPLQHLVVSGTKKKKNVNFSQIGALGKY